MEQRVSLLRDAAETLGVVAEGQSASLADLVAALEGKHEFLASLAVDLAGQGLADLALRLPRLAVHGQAAVPRRASTSPGAIGTEVIAPAQGRVVFVGKRGPMGNSVVIDHGHGVRTQYGHTQRPAACSSARRSSAAQVIATLGNTGRSTGPHLHYVVEVTRQDARTRSTSSSTRRASGRLRRAPDRALRLTLRRPFRIPTPERATRRLMPGLLQKIFGTHNDRVIKRIVPLVERINAPGAGARGALRRRAARAHRRVPHAPRATARSLDELLPEAFATVREAAKRALGQRHYDVQMIGGVVLHRGGIAEMRTGEGKTLVGDAARLPERARRAAACTSSPSTTTWRAATPSGWARSTASSASRSA